MNQLEKINNYNGIVYTILDYLNTIIPDKERWDGYKMSVKCGEGGVMLEIMCENIKDDFELIIPDEIYDKLVEVCNFFGVSPSYWQDILHE
jgi:hypothetical protein